MRVCVCVGSLHIALAASHDGLHVMCLHVQRPERDTDTTLRRHTHAHREEREGDWE